MSRARIVPHVPKSNLKEISHFGIPKPLAHCIHNQNKKRLGLKMAKFISVFTLLLKPFKLTFYDVTY